MDTMARLQLDMEEMRAASLCHRTPPPANWTAQGHQRQVAFMPRFADATSWEQYRQVFDAIVLSNGWDDATAALQLLSHLEGDALNVALLVPESRRATQVGLVGALTATNLPLWSPGRLADYRRHFERTTWIAGEDPSILRPP